MLDDLAGNQVCQHLYKLPVVGSKKEIKKCEFVHAFGS